jgi:hypothetical protein
MNDALETMNDIKQAEIRARADAIWLGLVDMDSVMAFTEHMMLSPVDEIVHAAALHRDDEAELGRRVLQILDRIVLEEATEER